MLLATPEEVLTSRGILLSEGSLASARDALIRSYPTICSLLETQLAPGKSTDYFTVDRESAYRGPRLRTTNGFINARRVSLRASSDGLPLMEAGAGSAVEASSYMLNPVSGIVKYLSPTAYGPLSLSITYEHGLEVDDSDEELLLAPDWLKSGAIAMANMFLTTVPASPSTKKDAKLANASHENYRIAVQLLAPHYRQRLSVIQPDLHTYYG